MRSGPHRGLARAACCTFAAFLLVPSCKDDPAKRKQPPRDTSKLSVSSARSDEVRDEKGDLEEIRRRGVLRVLIGGTGERFLPRAGMPNSLTREMVVEFARRHALDVQFVLVEEFRRLIPMLLRGKGDLIADQITVTKRRSRSVSFTRPTETVSEILVGRKGAAHLPRRIAALEGREIHVRAGSSHVATLRSLSNKKSLKFRVVEVADVLDREALVYEVTRGKRPLTVVDSHTLKAIQTYNPDAVGLFPLETGRQIAWAVPKTSRALRAALDTFLIERALTASGDRPFTGDLGEIKRRGVVRVLTRNNGITYFLHRGKRFGFDYELVSRFAKRLGVRLEMVVPPARRLLIPWLLAGKGDLVGASMSVTPARRRQVSFSRPYLEVREMIVRRRDGPAAASLSDLEGKTVHVRKSSSYRETLEALQRQGGKFEIAAIPEEQETEEVLEALASGRIDFTVADSHILEVEQVNQPNIEAAFPLSPKGREKRIAFAVRPANPKLRAALDRFVTKLRKGKHYRRIHGRYFQRRRRIAEARVARVGKGGRLSPYDEILKSAARKYGLDWRLMAAQAFQESRFDPKAKSWAGARGLFQVMPRTGKALGYTDLYDPVQSANAGANYLHRLIRRFDRDLSFEVRIWMALASYNAGRGHVLDARRLADRLGLRDDRWFGHVEKAMLRLAKPRYYRNSRFGYCRGREPVQYVSQIRDRYQAYVELLKH